MIKPLTNLMVEYLIQLVKRDKEESNKQFKKDTIERLKKIK